jgi:hypothetical protein
MKLNTRDHRKLVLWAADCAEHVLSCFESAYRDDDRPRNAIEAARGLARLKVDMKEARAAAFAAHAAASDADHFAARTAARSPGHAGATGHAATHARHAATYTVTAMRFGIKGEYTEAAEARERDWQRERLPERLAQVLFSQSSED